jgi:hypothetical protein
VPLVGSDGSVTGEKGWLSTVPETAPVVTADLMQVANRKQRVPQGPRAERRSSAHYDFEGCCGGISC